MTDHVTLHHIDFEKLTEQAKLARADYMHRCGQRVGAFVRANHVAAVVAVVLISFGAKMFFLSPPTSEAGVPSYMSSVEAAVAYAKAGALEIGQWPYP